MDLSSSLWILLKSMSSMAITRECMVSSGLIIIVVFSFLKYFGNSRKQPPIMIYSVF